MATRTCLVSALITMLLALCGCAVPGPGTPPGSYYGVGTDAPVDPSADRMDPSIALGIIDASPREYLVGPGRIRYDGILAEYHPGMYSSIEDLIPGAEDVWHIAGIEYQRRSFRRASELYRTLVEDQPGCAPCRVELARSLLGEARSPSAQAGAVKHLRGQASDQLHIASALDPKLPYGQGMLYSPRWLNRRTIPIFPETQRAREVFNEAGERLLIEDYAVARSLYIEVIRIDPSFGRAYISVGDTYLALDEYEPAAEWYLAAIGQDSSDHLAWRSLGVALMALGDGEAAREALTWAIIYDYHDAESWDMLRFIGVDLGFTVERTRLDKRIDIAELDDGAVRITVDSTMSNLAQIAWLGYAFVRAVWRYEGRFTAQNTAASPYRSTFAEQREAILALAAVWSSEPRDPIGVNRDLDKLHRIAVAGYLGEYILYEETAADDPDVLSFMPPSKLRRVKEYIDRFVIHGLLI
jgi:tetratricopeptide (TPR) repeat protein